MIHQSSMLRSSLLFFSLLILGYACTDKGTSSKSTPKAEAAEVPPKLPVLPEPIHRDIVMTTDYIDYIFYNLPISISMSDKASVNNGLSHISAVPVPGHIQCKSIGRIIYQSAGETKIEAELHMDTNGCGYLAFIEDQKPKYANLLTGAGIQFYLSTFKQANLQLK